MLIWRRRTQTAWFKDWLRRYVIREADGYLNGTLAIQRLDGNLFTGLEIEGVTLTQGRQTIFAAKHVGLRYSLWDLMSGDVVIDEIRFNEPRMALSRGPNGWNVAGLVKEQAQEADREGPAKPITISHIGIPTSTVTSNPQGPDALGLRIASLSWTEGVRLPRSPCERLGQVSFRASSRAVPQCWRQDHRQPGDVTLATVGDHTAESALSARHGESYRLRRP